MPRPMKCRKVDFRPEMTFFKPAGIPVSALETITISLDELEAVRLADLEGLYQEDAAQAMEVSRQTFGNIVSSARKKIADALSNGKAIKIEGGLVDIIERKFICLGCNYEWSLPCGTGHPDHCPNCRGHNIQRHPEDHGCSKRQRCGHGKANE